MKKIGIMQPYLFPHIGYFQLMNAVDEYIIYDDVQFIKGGWINRNNILIGGDKVLVTFALEGASANKMIKEIDIKDDFKKFLKTISMAYSKAPYHSHILALLDSICGYENRNLVAFTHNSFREISNYIGFDADIQLSSDLRKNNNLSGKDKVISICKEKHADVYINAIGGKALYDRQDFLDNGIRLKFLKSEEVAYKQIKSHFVPGLSIIDVMMFNSPLKIKELLNEYSLV
jgi:hypothetical protein